MTLTLPEGLVLRTNEETAQFNKTIYFQSNQRNIDPVVSTVSSSAAGSYSFMINVQLNLGENIVLYTNWSAEGRIAGIYHINVLASSYDANIDPRFNICEDTKEIQIVEDVPVINEPTISPLDQAPDIDPRESFAHPEQDVEMKCEVSSPTGISNVTLCYLVSPNGVWKHVVMTENSENEWIGTIPGQFDGTTVSLYIEAFSSTGRSSKTRQFSYTVTNLQALDATAKISGVVLVAIIIAGCVIIIFRRRKQMLEAI